MSEIKAEFVLLFDDELSQTTLHLACPYKGEHPLDVFLQGWDTWVAWNGSRGDQDSFNRKYVFSLIPLPEEPHRWLFGGFFLVKKGLDDGNRAGTGYEWCFINMHDEMIGRMVIEFHRPQEMQGSTLCLEDHYKDFIVSEIFKVQLGHGIPLS